MPNTPATIKAAALVYNADYPEAAAEIEAGTPVLDVAVAYADKACTGRLFRLISTFGVTAPDGGFIAAGEPQVITVGRRDGRVPMTDTARRRFARQATAAGVALIVRDRTR